MDLPRNYNAEAVEYFRGQLDKGMGDLETMLSGLLHRIRHPNLPLDPNFPPKAYRGPVLRRFLKNECGARRTTKWGPTALRGRLRPEEKGHIIRFLEIVNALPAEQLAATYKACGLIYAEHINATTPAIVLPQDSPAQEKLLTALDYSGSVGKVQQGLVFAILTLQHRTLGTDLQIVTKATHAGDDQSGMKGDVVVINPNTQQISAAFEVKGTVLDEAGKDRVLSTHGEHNYSLFILAQGFRPKKLQNELNLQKNTFAVNLADFMLAKLGDILTMVALDAEAVIERIVDIYNKEFCEDIEGDDSIKIVLET